MIINHESSRPAFEVGYFPIALQRDDNQGQWYTDREVQRQWEAWCRALAYVAIQTALTCPLPEKTSPEPDDRG